MQAIKITINKELLDVPNGTQTLHYAVREPIMTEFDVVQDVVQDVVKEEIFELRIWKDNFQDFDNIRVIKYFVNVNDRHLFDVLAKIENEDVETMEYKWKMEFMSAKAPVIRQQVRDDIKRLKWYKRLFNKF